MKNILTNAWANKYFKKLVIFALVFIPLILIDQLTKNFIFNGDKSGAQSASIADYKLFGLRSQFHTSTTFLDFIGTKIPYWTSLLIDYLLIALFTALLVFSRTKFSVVAISIALAGIVGNTVDATSLHGVRNVFYTPWTDHGTFNFADLIIVLGSALTGLSFIIQIFKKDSKNDKASKIPTSEKVESKEVEAN